MPKRTPICVRAITHKKYKFLVTVPPQPGGGKRERKFFASRKEAQSFASDLQVQRDNFGTRLLQMPESLREEALDCAKLLKPLQATLSEAVRFYLHHRRNASKSCTVSELVEKVLVAKASANKSKRYLNDLRLICGDFAGQHGGRMVSEISVDDVEEWVNSGTRSPTRNNRLRTLSSAFSYAVARRLCDANPASRVERATENKPIAGYLSAEQATSLLRNADTDLRACVAIQLFAGLRPCEMAELKFENINLEHNLLGVDTEEHTTSHRFVHIMPNLREWLLPYGSRTGMVQPHDYQRRWDHLRKQTGLYKDWPHDGLRHSYGTWHFAKFQDLGKTTAQLGHSNQMIARRHYVVRVEPPTLLADRQDASALSGFCKTEYRPYDAVVVSILHVARTVAPDAITVSSDGGPEAIRYLF